MRGKGLEIEIAGVPHGITPAYAGKSRCHSAGDYTHGDHPRLCGEKFSFSIQKNGGKGSPPPMRGKAEKISLMLFQIRITPAYAGKSLRYQ